MTAKAPAEKKAAKAPAEPTGERRPIPRFSERGDWQDPFVEHDYLVLYKDSVSEATGAVRDGDEAVLPS